MTTSGPPPPGSDAAADQGCLCPRMDNAHGHGWMGGVRDDHGNLIYVICEDCPLHGWSDIEGNS